jgi:hypothetical protein
MRHELPFEDWLNELKDTFERCTPGTLQGAQLNEPLFRSAWENGNEPDQVALWVIADPQRYLIVQCVEMALPPQRYGSEQHHQQSRGI